MAGPGGKEEGKREVGPGRDEEGREEAGRGEVGYSFGETEETASGLT